MDAGFILVVEIGQYFVTKDIEEQLFPSSWLGVNTLFQEMTDGASQPKGWISGKTRKLDPYWKSRPVACMVNTELRSEFGL